MKESTPKEKLLKKIRQALIEKTENPYARLEESTVYVQEDEMLEYVFAREFTKVSGHFLFCENEIQFIENIILLAEEKKWQKIYCWDKKLQEILTHYEYPFIGNDTDFENAETGITLCEALVARTGSILVSSGGEAGRRLSIFPHQHIVLAYTSQICGDFKEAFAMLKEKYEEKLPSSISAITGPSRTADIEKTLVLGAHGPKEIYLFLIDDLA